MNHWIDRSYARLLIDNHISEDDPSFMCRFDPQVYAAQVQQAGVDAAMVYACDHNGNCYYPSRVGHPHANLAGRDLFGETVGLLRAAGITPVAYYTTVYHNHSAKTHPAWRMQNAQGQQHQGRYWFSCVNNPQYLAFTKAQIAEVITYPVEGIFVDMTFWPLVCCCASCREKFLSESGLEIPERLDWNDPAWVAFQHFRERSMAGFTTVLADWIHTLKDITVTFQNSPIIMGWALGQSEAIADSCDYASGDFYGGKYQHILGAKILAAASRRQPYEYMTSRCINLNDHTSMKSEAALTCEAATTLAGGGAYFFIDAINPDGTLTEAVYARLGSVSRRLAPFTDYLRRERPVQAADIGLYFSMASQIHPAMNGRSLNDLSGSFDYASNPTYEEMLGTSIVLTRAHIPFRVVRAGDSLAGLKALVINNALVMSDEECQRVRDFVTAGGVLLATGQTGLYRPDGSSRGELGLGDILGVRGSANLSRSINYLSPKSGGELVSCNRPAAQVQAGGAQVLAGLEESLFDPGNEKYASIHSNPPGRSTSCVGLSSHLFGHGRAIYLASALLAIQQDAQQEFGERLLRENLPQQVLKTDAPACVELTLLSASNGNRVLGLVNYQKELPNVPVSSVRVSLCGLQAAPQHCVRISDGQSVPFEWKNGSISLEIVDLETIELVEIG